MSSIFRSYCMQQSTFQHHTHPTFLNANSTYFQRYTEKCNWRCHNQMSHCTVPKKINLGWADPFSLWQFCSVFWQKYKWEHRLSFLWTVLRTKHPSRGRTCNVHKYTFFSTEKFVISLFEISYKITFTGGMSSPFEVYLHKYTLQ